MDIYTYLEKDHRKVDRLFKKILAAKEMEKKEALFDSLQEELLLHADTEHDTFYKALASYKEAKDKINHANHEHKEVKKLLSKLNKLVITGKKWQENFDILKETVEHHVEEEETEIFDKAKKLLSASQAKALAKEMNSLKREKHL